MLTKRQNLVLQEIQNQMSNGRSFILIAYEKQWTHYYQIRDFNHLSNAALSIYNRRWAEGWYGEQPDVTFDRNDGAACYFFLTAQQSEYEKVELEMLEEI